MISTLRACDGPERPDFLQCPLWENVVLKRLTFNNFLFGRMWLPCKD